MQDTAITHNHQHVTRDSDVIMMCHTHLSRQCWFCPMTSAGSSCWVSCVENRCHRENKMITGCTVRCSSTIHWYALSVSVHNVCVLWCQHATVISLYLYSVNKIYEIKMKREVDILFFLSFFLHLRGLEL